MKANKRRKLTKTTFSTVESLARSRYRSDVSHYPTVADKNIQAQAHIANCQQANLKP
jgi:hypothetical protein